MRKIPKHIPLPYPLNPMSDLFVRYLLGSEHNMDLLIDFVNAVFAAKQHLPVNKITIKNPFNLSEIRKGKQSILDIKARETSGRWINVEIQIDPQSTYAK